MLIVQHTIVSGLVSAVFAFFSRSASATVFCFLSGIFIDIDHVFDFWVAKRKMFFSLKDLYVFCGYERKGKLYLAFHSIESIVILWLLILYFDLNVMWVGFAVGVSTHLLLDIIFNPFKAVAYLFYYRFKQGFDKSLLFVEEYYRNNMR